MGSPTGTNIRAAVKRPAETSDYGTHASQVAGMIPLLSEGLTTAPVLDRSEALTGVAGEQDIDPVGWDVKGPISTELWYESLGPLFLAAMGFENPTVYTGSYGAGSGGSPAPDDSADPQAYCHVFEIDDDLHRMAWQSGERSTSSGVATDPTYWTTEDQKVRSFSLGIDKQAPALTPIHRFEDCMVDSMSVKVTGGRSTVDWDLIARRSGLEQDFNQVNWALPTYRDRALFTGLKFYIGAIGATTPAEFPAQELELSLTNGLAADRESGDNAEYIIEPVRGDIRKVTAKLKLARFSTDQYQQWMDSGAELQVMAVLTGRTIPGSSTPFRARFMLPKCKVLRAEFPAAGPGVITGDVEIEAMKPDSTQAWMTSLLGGVELKHNNEMVLQLFNSRGACFSRDRQATGITLP